MKKFLTQTVIIVVGLFLLACVLDWGVTRYLRQSNHYTYAVWNDIYSQELNNDVLVLGSSRAWRHYNPAIIDSMLHVNSYNLGIDGRTFNSQLLRYHIYVAQNHHLPQMIIQNMDVTSLTLSYGYDKHQFYPYLWDDLLWNEIKDLEDLHWQDRYIPAWRYMGDEDLFRFWVDKFRPKVDEYVVKGYKGRNHAWDGTALRQQLQKEPMHYVIDPQVEAMWIDFLDEMKEQNIQVVLVWSPLYCESLSVMNFEEIKAHCDSIAQCYELPVLDYTYSSLSLDSTYFYNATHLNAQGANLFTADLCHDIDSLGLID